ncbi:mitochondrial carrier, partial [Testicularia cyperi]
MAVLDSTAVASAPASSSRVDLREPEAFPSMQATSLERPAPPRRRSSFGKGEPRKPVSRSKKAVAAVTGAVTTSFLMTPFDVIKTRLQTQASAEPLFFPSKHLATTPTTPLLDKGKQAVKGAAAAAAARSSRIGTGGITAHPATCCQQTFFTSNGQPESVLCRYDPRQPSASSSALPASHSTSPSPSASSKASSSRSIPRSSASNFWGKSSAFGNSPAPRSSVRILPSPPPAPNTYLHPFPSAVSANGSSSCACAFPSQAVAKQELQAAAASQGRLTGLWDGVIKVGRAEGMRGLWRGLAPTLMMTVPSQVTYMSAYDYFRSQMLASEDTAVVQAQFQATSAANGRELGVAGKSPSLSAVTAQSLFASLLAGALARAISATLVTPLELIRTRLQASSRSQASLTSILRGLWVEMRTTSVRSGGGPLILWRGLTPTLWRDVPFSAIYFAGYEAGKRTLTGGGLGEGNAAGSGEEFGVAFVSGSVSGGIAAVLTHPFDVVKTHLQTQSSSESSLSPSSSSQPSTASAGASASGANSATTTAATRTRLSGSLRSPRAVGSVWSSMRTIVEREGTQGLWKGLSPRTAKVAPACGVMIASFEVVGRFLADL